MDIVNSILAQLNTVEDLLIEYSESDNKVEIGDKLRPRLQQLINSLDSFILKLYN